MRTGVAPSRASTRALFVLPGVILGFMGCGASMGSIHEGDIRFEHCMALDAQPSVGQQARRACWAEWIAYYTYGQTRDRVLHAQMRVEQLGKADFTPSEEPSSSAPNIQAVRHDALCASTCAAVRDDCSRGCAAPAPTRAKGQADGKAEQCLDACTNSYTSCLGTCG